MSSGIDGTAQAWSAKSQDDYMAKDTVFLGAGPGTALDRINEVDHKIAEVDKEIAEAKRSDFNDISTAHFIERKNGEKRKLEAQREQILIENNLPTS